MVADARNQYLPAWVHTEVSHISLALCVLGFYLVTVNQLSFYLKSKLFMSNALICLCVGIAVGPIGLDWVSPWQWTSFDDEARYNLTFQLTRLVIGIQVMFAGIDLPAAYLKKEAISLFILLLPIMTIAWFISAGFILLFVPALTFLEALAISACITPTDPILANTIVKGRYAEKHVPLSVRNILSAESGANDGLGYPFLFIAIDLMQSGAKGRSISESLQHWVVTTWLYQIGLSVVIGAVIGYLARKTLKFAHNHRLIDHESFLAYGVGLALFTLGVVGVLGSDDVLACFVAGNSLTWRDFYRIEASEDDTFQDVIDGLLDTATFIYIGAIMPWSEFSNEYLTPWKLVLFAICILLFRRLPAMLALYPFIPAVNGFKEGLFTGWFGPIGVSALYYAILARELIPEDRVALHTVIFPVVIFMAMASTFIHGITIPATKAAPLAIARTKSTMSFRSDGFIARTRLWFSPNGAETPAARTPTTRSAAASRRSSFDRSDSMVEVDATVKGSPVVNAQIEVDEATAPGSRQGGTEEINIQLRRTDPESGDIGAMNGYHTPRRTESPAGRPSTADVERLREGANGGPPTPTQLKVEFSLPN
ncbi:hypothetical protein JCM10908_001228 [Rhodotorula pacifica]|uniref:uncharacterized protein n=1 Tax=Rhodotorula pacifica TaxID=1495444 RepID=UPI00316BEDEC